jgi:hypothetical protein
LVRQGPDHCIGRHLTLGETFDLDTAFVRLDVDRGVARDQPEGREALENADGENQGSQAG